MKILLAVDGSDYTRRMIDYLTRHDELLGKNNEYTVLTVEPVLPPRARGALGRDVVEKYHSEEAQKVLDPVLALMRRHGEQASGVFEVGQPGETIARFAEDGKFDLVVMGAHGHGRFANLVLGSVSSTVLSHCGVPVLLIR